MKFNKKVINFTKLKLHVFCCKLSNKNLILSLCNRRKHMKFNVKEWKEFRVGDILDCNSTTFSIGDDLPKGNFPFVSRTAGNNGVDSYVDIETNKLTDGNCLTVGAEGIYSFYQPDRFATGNKVYQMRIQNMNQYIGLFLSTVLNLGAFKYSYGRARIMGKLKNEIIKLPADSNGEPDWLFMENYIKSLPYGDKLDG